VNNEKDLMMKTAFTYWDNRIAPVFDTARQINIVETDSGKIVNETLENLPEEMPVQKTLRLVELGIDGLVCGAISRHMFSLVTAYGIQVVPFVAGDLREVINSWLCGSLEGDAFTMPGCCGPGRRKLLGVQNQFQEVKDMNTKGRGRGRGGRGQGGRGLGRIGGSFASETVGYCVCPQCGHSQPHERGFPCFELVCPKCGTPLVRQ